MISILAKIEAKNIVPPFSSHSVTVYIATNNLTEKMTGIMGVALYDKY